MTPKGFTFSAVNAGVKSPSVKRPDMGLISCNREAVASGVFTLNQVKAAPVLIGMELVRKGTLRAVIANAGNANACTGNGGVEDARLIMGAVARSLGIGRDDVAPLSTGVIGIRLPVERMIEKIPELVKGLRDDPDVFARSIMTTDTYPKVVTRRAGAATVLGIAKGAGMIAPDMATTLAVVLTDAVVDKQDLDNIIKKAIEHTFNAVTIDGDTSTNDTLLALASGYVNENINEIEQAISVVIRDLALLIVRDGEGATKFVEVRVEGAQSDASAKTVAMAVSNSLLVKTALFGADPNWGRIMGAIGYSRVRIDPEKIRVTISGLTVVEQGQEAQGFSEEILHGLLEKRDISICISLGDGPGCFTAYTTDLSYDYVKINSEYRT